jgi:predicted amidophosphoribosyltransferase
MGFLLPVCCGGCGAAGWVVCPACVAGMHRAPDGGPDPPGLDSCRSLLAYAGPARALVQAVKYANNRAAVRWLADGLAPLMPPVDLVTWAPTSSSRRRRRGYDQAELLARALARRLGRPVRATLGRRAGPAQTDLGRVGRLAHPGFDARRPLGGLRVIVVDDVATTGATLAAAARALRQAGAAEVHGATAASAPEAPDDGARPAPVTSAPEHGARPAPVAWAVSVGGSGLHDPAVVA